MLFLTISENFSSISLRYIAYIIRIYINIYILNIYTHTINRKPKIFKLSARKGVYFQLSPSHFSFLARGKRKKKQNTPNGMSIFMSIYILIYIRNNIYEYLRLILKKFSEVVALYKIVIYVVYKLFSCQVRLALFFSSFFSGVLRTPFSFFCSFASFGAPFLITVFL